MIIDVVVDTNIIISALLTPGRVRRVLLKPRDTTARAKTRHRRDDKASWED